jgi:signal peptidase I
MIWLIAPVVLVAIPVALRACLMVVEVRGASMEPTLSAGDRVLARRSTLGSRRARRGAIVIIAPPPGAVDPADADADYMVKRIVALPGDPVPPMPSLTGTDRVPAGHVVVVGDNRARSLDSRTVGYFRADGVRGVVLRKLR